MSGCHGSTFELILRDLSLLKMPKFKRATAAHCARQAKKTKRSQREDPVRHHEEQGCNAAARRQLCVDNPERREQDRQCDTEVH